MDISEDTELPFIFWGRRATVGRLSRSESIWGTRPAEFGAEVSLRLHFKSIPKTRRSRDKATTSPRRQRTSTDRSSLPCSLSLSECSILSALRKQRGKKSTGRLSFSSESKLPAHEGKGTDWKHSFVNHSCPRRSSARCYPGPCAGGRAGLEGSCTKTGRDLS